MARSGQLYATPLQTPIASARATQKVPVRLRDEEKSSGPRLEKCAFLPLLLTEKLAGQTVEKVQFRASRAHDRFMRSPGLIVIRCGQRVLHVHSGLRAFEKDGTGHPQEYGAAMR